MADPVMDWLLEADNPSVRYLTLTSLLHRPPDDPDCRAARKAIMTDGLVPQILAAQNPDGSWEVAEKFYTLKYTGTVWTLLLLAELAADPADPQVRLACEFILRHAQNPESGGFSTTASAKTGTGLAGVVIPCLTGNMIYSLIRLGYLEDRRIRQAIDWITTWQRADDGDDQGPQGPEYRRLEVCWGRHSCHMGVAKALKGLAAISPERRSPAVESKIDEIAEYFFKHHLFKKSHDLAQTAKPGWLKLGFPLMYQTDILELLDLFAALGRWDPRLEDALQIVYSKQDADGRWTLENTMNGKMQVRIEQKGKPSKWITLKARRVLDRFGDYIG